MNQIWQDLVTAFKAGETDVEGFISKVDAMISAEVKGLPGLISNLISTDCKTLVMDFQSDLQQIVTNIQNNTLGLSIANFPALFMSAVLPVLEKEGLKLADEDWAILTAYYAANNKITATPANNGSVGT